MTDYHTKIEERLSMLTSYGRDYVEAVVSIAKLLKDDYLVKTHLSDEERQKLINLLVDVSEKHQDLLISSSQNQQQNLLEEDKSDSKDED